MDRIPTVPGPRLPHPLRGPGCSHRYTPRLPRGEQSVFCTMTINISMVLTKTGKAFFYGKEMERLLNVKIWQKVMDL